VRPQKYCADYQHCTLPKRRKQPERYAKCRLSG
jgi:hypothetical protein